MFLFNGIWVLGTLIVKNNLQIIKLIDVGTVPGILPTYNQIAAFKNLHAVWKLLYVFKDPKINAEI